MKAGIFGAVLLALALTVSPAGAGSKHAQSDIHDTKAFWQRAGVTTHAKPACGCVASSPRSRSSAAA
jgi:hypothetical protein